MSYSNMIQSVTTKYNDKIKKSSSYFCEYFNLVQFWYNYVDDKGFVKTLSNHAEWTEYFSAEKLYQKCPLLRHSRYLKEGIIILNDFNEGSEMRQILNQGQSKYSMNIWIALVKKTKTGSEQFGFCTNQASLSLFFNEIPLIQTFAKKFHENNQFVLSKLDDNQVNIIELIGESFYKNTTPLSSQKITRQVVLQKLGIDCDVHFNNKELLALKMILDGHSANTIAPKICLAKRTVEHLLERLKEKLSCDSKMQLIQKTREMESLGYF